MPLSTSRTTNNYIFGLIVQNHRRVVTIRPKRGSLTKGSLPRLLAKQRQRTVMLAIEIPDRIWLARRFASIFHTKVFINTPAPPANG